MSLQQEFQRLRNDLQRIEARQKRQSVVSASEPSDPFDGMEWFDPVTGKFKKWGTSGWQLMN